MTLFVRLAGRPRAEADTASPRLAFWSMRPAELAAQLSAGLDGLSSSEAQARLTRFGANRLRANRRLTRAAMLWRQLASPLLLLLVFAAIASMLSGEWIDAAIVIVIILASAGIGYSREYSAQAAVAALQREIRSVTTACRDGVDRQTPVEEIVPGDVVTLAAGALVPGDGLVLDATDFFVSEALLTGESFPVQKQPGPVAIDSEMRERTNSVFLGTSVRSGTARCLIVQTGTSTEFGAVAERLGLHPPETEFDRGIRRFGYLLTSMMVLLVLLVFTAHVVRGRPPVETLLFSVALAVGLSPELLPAILSVNLARGATLMAGHGVVVRRLNAIENLGSMDVLCTDKTGTLTEGVVQLEGAYDPDGNRSQDVLAEAAKNAALESGIASVLDDAVMNACAIDRAGLRKRAEIPFDFSRKRSTVVVDEERGTRLITKGTFSRVLDACTTLVDGRAVDDDVRAKLSGLYEGWTGRGIRVLALATRTIESRDSYSRDDEQEMVFAGFLTFLDSPKADARAAVEDLERLGVSIKMLSGDSQLVARHVAGIVGLRVERVLTGRDIDGLSGVALWRAVNDVDVFAEVEPSQKERIILALKRTGHVVGFLGDGVNDAPAMHAADTSLSVEHAVDVARETADFVLLRTNLDVIRRGIEEGRRTFANTLKYVLTTTSANLGNMVSMAFASLVLPFLPLLAGQILLNNFLSDVPAIGIADDSVDMELVQKPERWDMRFIGRFMVEFGLLSSVFDAMTFVALLVLFQAGPDLFRTAWFVESLLSELTIALVVRTRRSAWRSRPGTLLLWLTIGTAAFAFILPVLPYSNLLGFVPLPLPTVLAICGIIVAYLLSTEWLKHWFFRQRPTRL